MSEPATRPRSPIIRVDLHVHTCYSDDSLTSLDDVIAAIARARLGAVAITDHDAIAGAVKLSRRAAFTVIIGEEVTTTDGDLVGLFLEERIPPGLSPSKTASLIHDQGGLVYLPHPFDHLRNSALGEAGVATILDQVDVVEVLNGRVLWPPDNQQAVAWAQERRIAAGAGSDAHTPWEIGAAYVEMEPFVSRDDFLRKLASGQVAGAVSPPHVHLSSTLAKLHKR
jgi:predicted metal-dependent phosphoesterase TrpH